MSPLLFTVIQDMDLKSIKLRKMDQTEQKIYIMAESYKRVLPEKYHFLDSGTFGFHKNKPRVNLLIFTLRSKFK